MPLGLRRFHQDGDSHFLTFSCYHRLPLLDGDDARTVFLSALEALRQRHDFRVFGYVLMPEHVHLLISEPANVDLSTTMSVLKTQTSKVLRKELQQFWQIRYHDFNVITPYKKVEKLRYIHRNPVVRGLVAHPEDWLWSSYRHYAFQERLLVEIDSEWTRWWKRQGVSAESAAWMQS